MVRIGGPFTLVDGDGEPFSSQRLAGRHYPLARFYPDVAEAAAGAEKATGSAA